MGELICFIRCEDSTAVGSDQKVALAIAALTLPLEMAQGAGYDDSRMASHMDLSWRPFCSTSTPLTCQTPSPESMHMLTI